MMIPELGSWGFIFLLYLLVGWFPTRHVEKSTSQFAGKKQWSLFGFLFVWLLWLPFMMWGVAGARRK